MYRILIHSNNEYLLLNTETPENIINISNIPSCGDILSKIYPVSIYDGAFYNIILDTSNILHLVNYNNINNIKVYPNIYTFKKKIIISHVVDLDINTIDDIINIKMIIARYNENKKVYKCECIIIADKLLTNKFNKKIYNVTDHVTLKTISLVKTIDSCILIHSMSNIFHVETLKNTEAMNLIGKFGNIIIYSYNNILYKIRYGCFREMIINLTSKQIKYYKYDDYNKIICYINIYGEIIVEDVNTNKHLVLGKTNEDYNLYYNNFILYFININSVCRINFLKAHSVINGTNNIDDVIKYIKYPFNISQIGSFEMNNFIWTTGTYKFMSKNNKNIINIFLLCNRQMKQYKIPYWILYNIFNLLC
jgi:hypothetical protein